MSTNTPITLENIADATVANLRAELASRNASTSGNRDALVDRLTALLTAPPEPGEPLKIVSETNGESSAGTRAEDADEEPPAQQDKPTEDKPKEEAPPAPTEERTWIVS